MKLSLSLLGSALFLSACSFGPMPYGPPPRSALITSEPAEPLLGDDDSKSGGVDEAGAAEAEGAVSPRGPGEELDTAALCTQASTCTTRVSLEVCGVFDPKCLDAFHKHADGATRDKCQAKLDRLPSLVASHARPGYSLPEECR